MVSRFPLFPFDLRLKECLFALRVGNFSAKAKGLKLFPSSSLHGLGQSRVRDGGQSKERGSIRRILLP